MGICICDAFWNRKRRPMTHPLQVETSRHVQITSTTTQQAGVILTVINQPETIFVGGNNLILLLLLLLEEFYFSIFWSTTLDSFLVFSFEPKNVDNFSAVI